MAQRSMYELLNGVNSAGNPDLALNAANSDAVVEKQRFVWDFTPIRGNSTDAWTKIGSGTATIDSNGYIITPSSGSMNISFGNKRPFDKRASRNIWITRYEKDSAGSMYAGMWYDNTDAGEDHHTFWFRGDGASLGTADGTQGFTSITSSDTLSQSWGAWEIESLSSSVNANVNGELTATRTANLSRQHLQPMVWVWSGSVARAKYCEAYNT